MKTKVPTPRMLSSRPVSVTEEQTPDVSAEDCRQSSHQTATIAVRLWAEEQTPQPVTGARLLSAEEQTPQTITGAKLLSVPEEQNKS